LYERLSIKEDKKVDIIIWPEVCFPFVYSRKSNNVTCQYLNDVLNQCRYLITGIIRKNDSNEYFNSVMCFSKHSDSNVIYDKRHLIPFGEYMPLRRFIKLKSIASLISDFSVGTINKAANIQNLPSFQTLICYESIFSYEFRRDKDAKWILNITNDGWFGRSNENFQHNNISRVISVEHGLPMIRCNNYGISSVFDAYGRNIANVTEQGYIDIGIPCEIKPTYYSKSPDFLYHISLLLLFLCEIAFFIL
jgi:apolipoprotein N-acyltransferase